MSHAQTVTSGASISVTAVVVDPSATSSGGSAGGSPGGSGSGATGPNLDNTGTTTSATARASFKGYAYPGSIVTLLKDGRVVAEVPASPDGTFDISITGISQATYNFGVRAEDSEGRKSVLQLYTVYASPGVTTVVNGIFLPPTVSLDKQEVRRGDILTVFGRTLSNGQVSLVINSSNTLVKKASANQSGIWRYQLDTSELEFGNHQAKARGVTSSDFSPFSNILKFKVGPVNTPSVLATSSRPIIADAQHDLNNDQHIDIVDFSIVAYWYGRANPPAMADINHDGVVSLTDFSILAYYWTG